ncbi:hypothetical protein Avbf_01849 [Armadillidium vulgare]|nr:hypothetical protein Avbf_01849 [Armadillidium vulgare]
MTYVFFSSFQQIASKSVNSNNIVVLTSSDPEDLKPSFGSEWAGPERGGYTVRGAGWPRGRGRGRESVHPNSNPSIPGNRQAPPLILPQDKYAPQSQNTQEPDQNKHKLSARMRRLQGSDTDSEDSESDSSDDSSSTSSSDSNSSSSDSSSSDSDSDSDTGQTSPVKKTERITKKVESGKHSVQATTEHSGSSSHNHSTSKNLKSPVKSSSKQVQPSESNKAFHPTFGKEMSRSPTDRRPVSPKVSHSHSKSPSYSQKPKSPPPVRLRRSVSSSPKPRRRSRSPLRRSRTPIRRYGSRSPPRYRASNSPRNPKSPLISKSPIGRYRSLSRSPYYESKRFRSRSPYIKRALSPPLRRGSRSPLPLRRFSRSPVVGRARSRSPKRYNSRSPRPVKRYGSLTPPPPGRSYRSKSPYSVRRYGSRSPRPYPKRISPGSPRRYRSKSPRNVRSPFRKEIIPKSPRLSRRSSFSPPAKRYGSRSPSTRSKEPLRGNRSPIFRGRGRTPVGRISSPQRIKRIGSLSPKPLLDASNKFLREQVSIQEFPTIASKLKDMEPPPPRRLSPDFKVAKHLTEAVDSKDDMALRNVPFARAASPHRHNYASRSPSPYFRNRLTPPGIQAVERNFPSGSQSPVYFGVGGPIHMKMNRNIPYEKEVGPMGKRFPNEHPSPPPWLPHKSEIGLPPKEPILHHYPPKFMDAEYSDRPGYIPQHPPPQLMEKSWPSGPPSRGLSNFGNGRGHPRLERLVDVVIPQHMVMERGRGRGGRGLMRGQRGNFRGVRSRLGRGAWNQHQAQPPLYDHPPPFEDPYLREKSLRVGMPPPLLETEIAYFDRKPPQPFDGAKPLLPLIHPQKSLSPGRLQRIPRGPKTPPYSPNREPSPIEWEKRARGKPRTPSRSPSPHRYGSEVPKSMSSHFKPREHTDISDSRSHGENIGSHKPLYRSRSPYAKDEQTYGGAHGHRMDSRKEGSMRDMDDRKKVSHSRGEDHNYKGKDVRRAYSNEDLSLNSSEKIRERDRRVDERHRSPLPPPRAKGTESYGSRNKDYEADFKKERDARGRRETVEQKGRREHEDQRGRRDIEEHIRRESGDQKGRREIENQRSRRESGDQRGRKENSEIKSRKETEDHHKTRKTEEERKERRELEDNRSTRDNYELSDKRHISIEDNLKLKVKKEDEKREKDERKKDNRSDEGIKKEKENLRYDRKDDDKDFDKGSHKTYDKHSDLRHRDEKRESKDTQEHMKKKEIKESKDKLVSKAGQEEKKKKKKKHKEEDRSTTKSSKKKKKEKKKKKDSKKQKKKSKEFDEEEDFAKKKKKSLDLSSSRSLNKHDGDLRHILEVREDSSRERGSLKRKDASSAFDTDDRENRKRRKENYVPSSGKDDWKWKGSGRDVERRKEEREPLPKERTSRIFSSSDKRTNDSNRGGKGFYVTVNSSHDRHVSSNKDIVKKETGSRLPVHMRLGGKGKVDKAPLKATGGGGMKGGKKVQRLGENIDSSLGRRKVVGTGRSQQQHSQRRQGMKGGVGAGKRTNR